MKLCSHPLCCSCVSQLVGVNTRYTGLGRCARAVGALHSSHARCTPEATQIARWRSTTSGDSFLRYSFLSRTTCGRPATTWNLHLVAILLWHPMFRHSSSRTVVKVRRRPTDLSNRATACSRAQHHHTLPAEQRNAQRSKRGADKNST